MPSVVQCFLGICENAWPMMLINIEQRNLETSKGFNVLLEVSANLVHPLKISVGHFGRHPSLLGGLITTGVIIKVGGELLP